MNPTSGENDRPYDDRRVRFAESLTLLNCPSDGVAGSSLVLQEGAIPCL